METLALIDCGATRGFINASLVAKRGIPTTQLQEEYHFEGATGERGTAREVLMEPRLQVPGWGGTHPLIVGRVEQNVILGIDLIMTTGIKCAFARGEYLFENDYPREDTGGARNWGLRDDSMTKPKRIPTIPDE